MYKGKNSQAALEFLTTYAWAILAIIILIGALAYFGVLDPTKFLPERCNFGSEIGCKEYVIKEDGLNLKLINNVGSTIIIDSVNVLNEDTALSCSTETGQTWQAGTAKDLAVICTDFANTGIVVNEKKKFGLEITYHTPRSSTEYRKYVQGDIFATVQQGQVQGVTVLFEENFDPLISSNWVQPFTNAVVNGECGSTSGTNSLKFNGGAKDDDRIAETTDRDTSTASTITFQIKGPTDATQTPRDCASPDTSEDLKLQYLTTGGSWTDIETYAAGSRPIFQAVTVTIPGPAKTATTKFRWIQDIHDSEAGFDNWAIDDIRIQ